MANVLRTRKFAKLGESDQGVGRSMNGAVRTKAVHLLETRRNNERHIPDSLSEMSKVKVKSEECTSALVRLH